MLSTLVSASQLPEFFPPTNVLEGGEDDSVATCLVTVAARHEALYVADVHGSRGDPDVFGKLGLISAGASFARIADGPWFASDHVIVRPC
jgi:hypothetical protein